MQSLLRLVNRERIRNTDARSYRYKQAQERASRRRYKASKVTKLTPNIIALIESKLRLEWSPEQISGWLLEYKRGDLYTYLRRQGKK